MTGKEVIKALEKAGWNIVKGQGKGGHTKMNHPDSPNKLIIPSGTLKLGTQKQIEKASGVELKGRG